jgi:hypothetical protein
VPTVCFVAEPALRVAPTSFANEIIISNNTEYQSIMPSLAQDTIVKLQGNAGPFFLADTIVISNKVKITSVNPDFPAVIYNQNFGTVFDISNSGEPVVLDSLYIWQGSEDPSKECIKIAASTVFINNVQFHTNTTAVFARSGSILQITDCLFTYYSAFTEFPNYYLRFESSKDDVIIKDCHVQSGLCSAGFPGLDSTPSFGFLFDISYRVIDPARVVLSNIKSFGPVPLRYFI